jgi:lipopolysaccharide/colanic/teichoic acid biosynthesis glycosyltransferase
LGTRASHYDRLKRTLDLLTAGVGLIVTAPVMAVAAVAIRRSMGRPALFRQVRPGLRGRPFTLVKFRTMNNATDPDGNLLPDAQRMTKVGTFLRRSSIDELPQLWNVLKGDMSLVGPRPLRMEYLALYSPEQARRHDVKPGITGWAQVKGRNALTWEEKFRLDVWYVDHRSLWLDLRILFATVAMVVRREGVSPEGGPTMDWFRGIPREPDAKPQAEAEVPAAASAARPSATGGPC